MNLYGASDKGQVRETNEDSLFYTSFTDGSFLFAVCDGMGGQNAGEVASAAVVEEIRENGEEALARAESMKDARSSLRCLIRTANNRIYQMAQRSPEYQGMGTTMVAAYVRGDHLLVLNVGDSRGYLIRDGHIIQITRDHSLVEEMVRSGAITREESKTFPGRNVITMAIGTEDNILPDSFECRLQEGDRVLLCSDGLSNMVEDEQLLQLASGDEDCQRCVKQLIDRANENGGRDNITAILYRK